MEEIRAVTISVGTDLTVTAHPEEIDGRTATAMQTF
jgi:hypothetical protein